MISSTTENTKPVDVTIPRPIEANNVTAAEGDHKANSATESANDSSAASTNQSTTTAAITPVNANDPEPVLPPHSKPDTARAHDHLLPHVWPCPGIPPVWSIPHTLTSSGHPRPTIRMSVPDPCSTASCTATWVSTPDDAVMSPTRRPERLNPATHAPGR